jgi:hypothetical protein
MTLRQRFSDDLRLRNYAPRTIHAYVRGVAAKFCKRCPSLAGPDDIRSFQLDMIRQQLFFKTTAEYLHLTQRRLEQVSQALRGFVLPIRPAAEGQA